MPTMQDGMDAVAEGNLQQARLIFEAILQENPRSADAWLGLADVLTDTEDKRICYENVLKIDKSNNAAREGLRNLEPRANPLVAALSQQPVPVDDEEDDIDFMMDTEDEPTLISAHAPPDVVHSTDTDSSGPSTAVLVAIGLALSVVVFAVGGGVIYVVLSSLGG
jgi:hypothetical protein